MLREDDKHVQGNLSGNTSDNDFNEYNDFISAFSQSFPVYPNFAWNPTGVWSPYLVPDAVLGSREENCFLGFWG